MVILITGNLGVIKIVGFFPNKGRELFRAANILANHKEFKEIMKNINNF